MNINLGKRVFRLLVLLLCSLSLTAHTDFRAKRVSLEGRWKFQLRRDNHLMRKGPVSFGPVSASSQAVFLAPRTGQSLDGAWWTSVPWPLSATMFGSEGRGTENPGQIWKPHPEQKGPTWWQADLGSMQTLNSVRVRWVKFGSVELTASLSEDGRSWRPWARVSSNPGDTDTKVSAAPGRTRFLKLEFNPPQFEGTRNIDVFLDRATLPPVQWKPDVQKNWYEQLRQYSPVDGFHKPDYADGNWSTIQAPGYWEVQKRSEPTWWHPDDTVGYYRRNFAVPDNWRGMRIRLRFEGVNNSAQVWVNGHEIGYHESGFTAFEYDVTSVVKPGGDNVIAVRVAKWSLTHDYDTDDSWFLGGIFRNAYLYSLPEHRIDDFTLRTELDAQFRNAVLRAKVLLAGSGRYELSGELLDSSGRRVPVQGLHATGTLVAGDRQAVELAGVVSNPYKWTDETPNLYSLSLRLHVNGALLHEVKSTIGFRQVQVKGSRLLVNGVPVKIRGVVTTRSNPTDAPESRKEVFARELRVLKESNINAIRSHTTPLEEEFLDLCDRHGIYVIPDVPYVWLNEADFKYLTDGAVVRAREIYEQHKNRTSVIMWHIGNENGASTAYYGMGKAAQWLEDNDNSRPVVICQNRANAVEFGTVISDNHYNPMRDQQFVKDSGTPILFGEFHALPEEIDRLKDRGFVETWGRSLQLEWAEFQKRPWVVGGLICCWDDGAVNGNIGPRQWGVLDSKRQPKDVWYHIRKVFAPVRLTLEDAKVAEGKLTARLRVANTNSFTDLERYEFRWSLGPAKGSMRFSVPPGSEKTFPVSIPAAAGADIYNVTVYDPEGYSTQNESFRLTKHTERRAPDGKPANPVDFRIDWKSDSGLQVSSPDGKHLFSIPGIVVSRGTGRKPNEPLGRVTYGSPQRRQTDLAVPFEVENLADGRLTFITGANWIQVRYELMAKKDLALREIGIAIQPSNHDPTLIWSRRPIWSATPEEWADGAQESISFSRFAPTLSRRNLEWLEFDSGGQSWLAAPESETFHVRVFGGQGALVLADFLGAGDFLGKFDLDTVETKLAAGQVRTSSVTFSLRNRRQTATHGR